MFITSQIKCLSHFQCKNLNKDNKSMGQVSLYRLKSTPLEKNFSGASWYKHTWPMPRYRYGSTCNLVKNIVIFNNLIISELICPNYLGEIRSHQESKNLTKSPAVSPRVHSSHQVRISPRVSPTWVSPVTKDFEYHHS